MRHFALPIALLLTLVAAAPASAGVPYQARLTACSSSLEQAQRVAVFEGRMRAVPRAQRLQMRFTLESRSSEAPRWRAMAAPGFGRWLTSNAGVGRYVYTKTVVSLFAPASYRTVVRYRWLDRDGRRLGSARAVSPACRQKDLRPNLKPLRVAVKAAAKAERARYVVPVANRGNGEAGPFDVVVTVDGVALPASPVAPLAPGETALVEVEGPRCAAGGAGITIDVDPTGAVDEREEADNRLTVACAAAAL